jgi:hypothetical protein
MPADQSDPATCATAARRVCENGRHNFGPPPRWPAGVEPMECQCHRLMLGYYRDTGEAFVYVVTTVEAAP